MCCSKITPDESWLPSSFLAQNLHYNSMLSLWHQLLREIMSGTHALFFIRNHANEYLRQLNIYMKTSKRNYSPFFSSLQCCF